MSTSLTAIVIAACLFGAVLIGMRLRRLLPEHHLSEDSKDTVKLAMGLVATTSALLLGLLVSSSKGAYDAERTRVIQMADGAVVASISTPLLVVLVCVGLFYVAVLISRLVAIYSSNQPNPAAGDSTDQK